MNTVNYQVWIVDKNWLKVYSNLCESYGAFVNIIGNLLASLQMQAQLPTSSISMPTILPMLAETAALQQTRSNKASFFLQVSRRDGSTSW